MREDILRTVDAGRKQYWGTQCRTCKRNFSVMVKYDYLVYRDGTREKVESWRSTICNCLYWQSYRNGYKYERLPGDPIFEKMRELYQRRLRGEFQGKTLP